MRRLARALSLVLASVAALAGGVVLAGPAQAAACSGSTGVTVVVDYGSAGGGVATSCASGNPASGLTALTMAGFGVKQVQTQPGFVCQINSKPSTSCVRTPPTSAYWSYWHASRGGSWSYSQTGAGPYDPAPGSVEGWAFGSGSKPGVSPPAGAPKPTTRQTTKPKPSSTTRSSGGSTTHQRSTAGSGGAAGSVASSAGRSIASPGTTSASTTAAGAGSTPSAGAASPTTPAAGATGAGATTTTAPTPAALADSAPASSASPAGSGAGLPIGLGLVAVLVAAIGAVARRRRRLQD